MAANGDPNPIDTSVRYTVKELLAEMKQETSASLANIEGKIDALSTSIQGKADAAVVIELAGRVAQLERESAKGTGEKEYRRWVMPSAVAIGMQVVGWGLAYSWWGTPHA